MSNYNTPSSLWFKQLQKPAFSAQSGLTSLPKDISLDQALDWDTFDKNRLTLLSLVKPSEIRGHLI